MALTVSYNGYDLDTLARLAQELDRPTNDAFAEFIWRLSTRETFPEPIARKFMKECGYVPFAGFPLKREVVRCSKP